MNWCKNKPNFFKYVIKGTIIHLTEDNNEESVFFTLNDFMNLEFQFWLCDCEHVYIKLIKVALFDKLIDHNLINEHNSYVYLELIRSGMYKINTTFCNYLSMTKQFQN